MTFMTYSHPKGADEKTPSTYLLLFLAALLNNWTTQSSIFNIPPNPSSY